MAPKWVGGGMSAGRLPRAESAASASDRDTVRVLPPTSLSDVFIVLFVCWYGRGRARARPRRCAPCGVRWGRPRVRAYQEARPAHHTLSSAAVGSGWPSSGGGRSAHTAVSTLLAATVGPGNPRGRPAHRTECWPPVWRLCPCGRHACDYTGGSHATACTREVTRWPAIWVRLAKHGSAGERRVETTSRGPPPTVLVGSSPHRCPYMCNIQWHPFSNTEACRGTSSRL